MDLEVVSVALGWLAAAASLLVFAMLKGAHPADDEDHPIKGHPIKGTDGAWRSTKT